jgi:NAD(P)H-quinone oxidoreductase subunit 5
MLVLSLLVFAPLLMVAVAAIPNCVVNGSAVKFFRRFVTTLAACQFAIAAGLAVGYWQGLVPTIHAPLLDLSGDAAIAVTVHYDGVAALMFALVSFVGWVIGQYSVRYLDGETTQGRYFRWTAFAIGSVSWMVLSGNLMMFMVAWVMTSTALHKLLLHYAHRPAAQRAAWTKFTISRLGDVALLAAVVLIHAQFQTLDFVQIFAALQSPLDHATPIMNVAAFLLVAGAVTKSAQFPFHTWLPLTMETPTPVSALMHAGIVNAGGYLIIRTSPLVAMTPAAMTTLAMIGGFTACFAAVVMTTQTSVKKKLAYSTIAQMGFMLLQCGLGAFSAAMLHIIAHSLYKAYAFLTSGSVMQQRAAMSGAVGLARPVSWPLVVVVMLLIATFVEVSFLLFGMHPSEKPGGILLAGVICLAFTYWTVQVMRTGNRLLLYQTIGLAGLLCLVYVASLSIVDSFISASVPAAAWPAFSGPLTVLLLASFAVLLWLQLQLSSERRPEWLNACYIHAANGFYIDNNLRRLLGALLTH